MEFRHPANPQDFPSYDTKRIRDEFLVQNMFQPGQITMVYSHIDRMVVGGACPQDPVSLPDGKELGTAFFLERREMGVINVGRPGTVTVDGQNFELSKTDGLYIGMGSKEVSFSSQDPKNPAHFYLLSGPAHKEYPTQKMTMAEAESAKMGTTEQSNVRTLNKYIHPGGVKSANLVMGVTVVEPGCVWNSLPPCHTHARRMEVYFYYDLAPDAILFHLMGKPEETRHVVVRNEEAVISPTWSIHAGAATSHYSFIWGMIGDNQTFTDMDIIEMDRLA